MKVASFNGKNLGMKKVTDDNVCKHFIEIISQYSVVMILEVVDKSGKAMKLLLEKLNTTGNNRQHPYTMIASKQLGRQSYKEQYVCFYREDEVTLKEQMQYEDNQVGDEDAFAREPFILRFSSPTTVVKDLVLIPVHTKPVDAEKELDELYDVVELVREKWETDNIMILGDFNADGQYLSSKKMKRIRIYSPPFYWLIGDDVDTTASNNNDNTYDRIVVYGDTMKNAVVPESANAFNFQEAFKLTDEEALHISDHYPVEVTLMADTTKPAKRKQQQPAASKKPTKRSR